MVERVVEVVRRSHAGLADALGDHLRANVRLLRDDELPTAAPDPALVARVAALEKSAVELAARVRAARARIAPKLSEEAAAACNAATERASEEARLEVERLRAEKAAGVRGPVDALEDLAGVVGRAKHVGVVGGRIEKLRDAAAKTRLRAGNVLETLRIISENDGDDESNTVTISMDGKPLTLSLNHAESADVEESSPMVAVAPPDLSPVAKRRRSPYGRRSLLQDPHSPHVTPRSKTRSRLLRRGSSSPSPVLCQLPR